MPRLTVEVPHVLGLEEATQRLKERFAAARAEHQDHVNNFREEWKDHTFSFAFQTLGMAVSGDVAVGGEKVKLDVRSAAGRGVFQGGHRESTPAGGRRSVGRTELGPVAVNSIDPFIPSFLLRRFSAFSTGVWI